MVARAISAMVAVTLQTLHEVVTKTFQRLFWPKVENSEFQLIKLAIIGEKGNE
jgi:uncharacterized membrane protein